MGATPSLSQRHRNFNHGQMPWLSLWNISLVLSCRYSTNGADFWLFFWNQGLPNPSVWWVYRSVMVYWSKERPETVKLGCWGGYHKKIIIRHFFWDTLYVYHCLSFPGKKKLPMEHWAGAPPWLSSETPRLKLTRRCGGTWRARSHLSLSPPTRRAWKESYKVTTTEYKVQL